MQATTEKRSASLHEEPPKMCVHPPPAQPHVAEQVQPFPKAISLPIWAQNVIAVRNGCKIQIGQKLGSPCQVLRNWPMAR